MIKRFTVLLAALAALLVAIPAFANASTGLTSSKGLLLPVGTQFTINGTGSEVLIATILGGKISCEPPIYFNAEVTKNSSSAGVEARGSVRAWGICGASHDRKQIELPSLSSGPTEFGKGKANIGFSVQVSGETYCHWSSKEAPFTYTSETDSIAFNEVTLTGTPGGCGNARWSAIYTLQSKEGSSLLLM